MATKNLLTPAVIAACLITAFSGNLWAQSAPTWHGAYAGASLNFVRPDFSWQEQFESTATSYRLKGATGGGLFVGYNHQWANWVIGGETSISFARSSASLTGVTGPGKIDVSIGRSVSLKARIGRPVGQTLPYAFAGISRAELETVWAGADPSGPRGGTHNGSIFGVGVDYNLSGNVFGRLEIARSSYDTRVYGYCDPSGLFSGCIASQNFSRTNLSLGVGVSF